MNPSEACEINTAEARMSLSHLGDFCFIEMPLAAVDYFIKYGFFMADSIVVIKNCCALQVPPILLGNFALAATNPFFTG
jgi:hypothetical protein